MDTKQPETEGKAIWREFRETAQDMVRDYGGLWFRTVAQHYHHHRTENSGKPVASRLTAVGETVRMELAKSVVGLLVHMGSEVTRVGSNVADMHFTPGGIATSMLLANFAINTLAAKACWVSNDRAILPHKAARVAARQAALDR